MFAPGGTPTPAKRRPLTRGGMRWNTGLIRAIPAGNSSASSWLALTWISRWRDSGVQLHEQTYEFTLLTSGSRGHCSPGSQKPEASKTHPPSSSRNGSATTYAIATLLRIIVRPPFV